MPRPVTHINDQESKFPQTFPPPPRHVRSRSLTTSCRLWFCFPFFPPWLVIPPVVPPPCWVWPRLTDALRKNPGSTNRILLARQSKAKQDFFFSKKEKKSVAASRQCEPLRTPTGRHLTQTRSRFSGRLSRYFHLSATSALLQCSGGSLSQKQKPLQSPAGNLASELWSGESFAQLKPWHGN